MNELMATGSSHRSSQAAQIPSGSVPGRSTSAVVAYTPAVNESDIRSGISRSSHPIVLPGSRRTIARPIAR